MRSVLFAASLCGLITVILAVSGKFKLEEQSDELSHGDHADWISMETLIVHGRAWEDTETLFHRLPARVRDLVPAAVWNASLDTAGLYIPFETDAPELMITWELRKHKLDMPHMPATGVSGIDLYGKSQSGEWQFIGNGCPTHVVNRVAFSLSDYQQYMLYLPLYNGVKSLSLSIKKNYRLHQDSAKIFEDIKPIVFYGTSIVQGGCASRPGLAFPSIIGRRLNIPVINFGFSGSARMEDAMARLLGEIDASAYIVDCLWNMELDILEERVPQFIYTLSNMRPDTPIIVVEDSNFMNQSPTLKGKSLRTIIESLKADHASNLFYLSNELMLGVDHEGTVDNCHPNDLGMMRHADVYEIALRDLLLTYVAGKVPGLSLGQEKAP